MSLYTEETRWAYETMRYPMDRNRKVCLNFPHYIDYSNGLIWSHPLYDGRYETTLFVLQLVYNGKSILYQRGDGDGDVRYHK